MFQTHPWIWICFLFFFVSPKVFKKTENIRGKLFRFSKNLRENKNTKPISKGGSETFKRIVIYFAKSFLVFFSFLLHFCFYRKFFCFLKLRGNKKQKTKPISKSGSETLKSFVFWFCRICCCFRWFPFVFLVFPQLFQGGLDA